MSHTSVDSRIDRYPWLPYAVVPHSIDVLFRLPRQIVGVDFGSVGGFNLHPLLHPVVEVV